MNEVPRGSPGDLLKHLLGLNSHSDKRYAYHLGLITIMCVAIWVANHNPLHIVTNAITFSLPETKGETGVLVRAPVTFIPAKESEQHDTATFFREIIMHTNIPTRARQAVIVYTVQEGDTLFGIADKHGVVPETVLWGNQYLLQDDPHLLRPGQDLLISPVNGVLRTVQPNDTVEGLAQVYRASPEDIIDWPGNNLDPDDPVLPTGEILVIPGGERDFVQWVIPQITRTQRNVLPADAGPGACPGGYSGGAVGTGSFIWPAGNHYLSGYNYSSFHLGIDIAAGLGAPIYASDSGVVVFAGWSNWGYGNMVAVDHGNGWQTLYAHLSQWNVLCGQSVYQGGVVGLAGSTGRSTGSHLHFEMNYQGSRPNPWNYLY